MIKLFIVFLFTCVSALFCSATFTDINAGLNPVYEGASVCGDYDNDGDNDILLTGFDDYAYDEVAKIYRNDSGTFTDINAGLQGVRESSADWGDYDNDGDLDIVISGCYRDAEWNEFNTTRIYRNDSGVFTNINAGLADVAYGSTDWGDYDQDGDLDILITGDSDYGEVAKVYRNDSGVFTDINAGLQGVLYSSAVWGDYDQDGDQDILLTGYTSGTAVSKVYECNYDRTFTDIDAGLTGVYYSSASWGNFDNSGYLDIIITGYTGSQDVSKLYSNSYGTFTDINAGLAGIRNGSAVFGDFDADDDLDILIAGSSSGTYVSKIYRNDSSVFTDINAGLPGYSDCSAAICDLTNDELPDILLSGYAFVTIPYPNYTPQSQIFKTELDFTSIGVTLPGIRQGSSAWGDYDSDGDLDFVLTGNGISKIFRNDGSNVFTDINAGLIGSTYSSSAWGDYDNDGDLDVIIAGDTGSLIYRNDSGVFTNINAGLAYISSGAAVWGDYDNDGDLDIVLSGNNVSLIYRNDSGVFTNINAGLTGVSYSSVSWGDYDNDSDLDLVLTGSYYNGSIITIAKIYQNESGVFTDINAGLTTVYNGSAVWGDYDNDGDLDLAVTGDTCAGFSTKIYRNDGSNIFTDIAAGLTGASASRLSWGDCDNDGDLDLLLSGYIGSGNITKLYKNNLGVFTVTDTVLPGLTYGSLSCGDYDKDNDLDILLTGRNTGLTDISRIYRNNSVIKNTLPSKPTKLVTVVENDSLKLTFTRSTDTQTPENGLSYNFNLKISNETIVGGMSDLSSGFRKIVQSGNLSRSNSYCIENIYTFLPQGEKTVSWKVQAVDACFAGSAFSSSFDLVFPSPRDLVVTSKSVMCETDMLMWEFAYSEYIDHYIVQVDDDPQFTSPIEETIFADVKIKDQKIIYVGLALNSMNGFTQLISNETYYWRMKPVYTGINRFTVFTETPTSFIYKPLNQQSPYPPVSGFNPANDDITSSLPKLSWNASVDPDGHAEDMYYICQLDTINTFNTIQYADTTAAGITTIQVSSALPEGYRYYYRVKAIDSGALQSVWSESQTFLIVMPPQNLKIADDGVNVNLTWSEVPINSKGVVYTVYSSTDPDAEFPSGWTVAAPQLSTNSWSEPHSASKKFYRITVGSISK